MRYAYNLTYKDYLDAQKLYRRHSWKAAMSYYAFIWALPTSGLLVGLPLVAHIFFDYHPLWLRSIAPLSGIGLWFALYIPLMRIYSVRKCWKRLLPEKSAKSIKSEIAVEFEMTPEQVISTIPGKSEGRFFWPSIVDYAEDKELALLFIKKKLFLFIPRRAMDEAGWSEVRERFSGSRAAA